MPVVTKITEQKRRANRRSVYLDGQFAFGCNLNVIARFRLREGMTLDASEVQAIQFGEVKQGCFDAAVRLITGRLHSRAELKRKLSRQDWGPEVIEAVLDDLTRLNYLDDARFAKAKAESAATHKRQGKQRAKMELMKAGVSGAVADQALSDVYETIDPQQQARAIAEKKLPSLRRLEPQAARRRLTAFLQRRGFDYDAIRPVLDSVLSSDD